MNQVGIRARNSRQAGEIRPELPPLVSVELANRVLGEGAPVRLLDVRTPAEFESGHIPGAYNVPLDRLREHRAELRREVRDAVVLVCRSGQRARMANEALREIGMSNLHVMDGGMLAWEQAKLPMNRGRERLSLERQVRIVAGGLAATGGLLALVVNPLFAALPLFIGSGLVFAGITDTCGMAMLLSKLPYNRPAGCDINAVVAALKNGDAPPPMVRGVATVARSCGA